MADFLSQLSIARRRAVCEQDHKRARLDPVGHRSHDRAIFERTSVVRRHKKRVNISPPWFVGLAERRQFEFEEFPVGVDHNVEQKLIPEQRRGCGDGVRVLTPIGSIQSDSMPLDRLLAQQILQRHIETVGRQGPAQTKCDELFGKTMNLGVLF
jgi:hypothetical protein